VKQFSSVPTEIKHCSYSSYYTKTCYQGKEQTKPSIICEICPLIRLSSPVTDKEVTSQPNKLVTNYKKVCEQNEGQSSPILPEVSFVALPINIDYLFVFIFHHFAITEI